MIRLGFLLRGYFKGVYKGPIVGFYNVGVLIIRVGLGLGDTLVQNPPQTVRVLVTVSAPMVTIRIGVWGI